MVVSRKLAKCASLSAAYLVQPIALETLGPINESAVEFLNNLGHRIASISTERQRGIILVSPTLDHFAAFQRNSAA